MNGFIPLSRASLSFDIIVVILLIVFPILFYSISLVKKKQYKKHQFFQILIASILLVALILFEIDININDWKQRAVASPYYNTWIFPLLYCHLFFAITTLLVWIVTIYLASVHFRPVKPNKHSRLHRLLGKVSILSLLSTTSTGFFFYYLAFIA